MASNSITQAAEHGAAAGLDGSAVSSLSSPAAAGFDKPSNDTFGLSLGSYDLTLQEDSLLVVGES